jgi:hypothetical protein
MLQPQDNKLPDAVANHPTDVWNWLQHNNKTEVPTC